MNEFERIASEADEGDAAKIGRFNRAFEAGTLRRFMIVYEMDDAASSEGYGVHATWSKGEAIWAMGASEHAKAMVAQQWVDVEDND